MKRITFSLAIALFVCCCQRPVSNQLHFLVAPSDYTNPDMQWHQLTERDHKFLAQYELRRIGSRFFWELKRIPNTN